MSQFITEAFKVDFKTTVELLLQTMGSQLADKVTTDTYQGTGGRPVNQIGPVTARKLENRHEDTRNDDVPHASRWVEPSDYVHSPLVDNEDKLRSAIDPTSSYAKNGAMALGRAKDAEILQAFFATSKTGNQGQSTEAFSATYQITEAGTVGLTVDKLKVAQQMLITAKNNMRGDKFYLGLNGRQHYRLLQDTQAINRDYEFAKNENGMIVRILNFEVVICEEITDFLTSGNNVLIPVWAQSGMHLGMWNDIETKIDQLPSKNYATQVYLRGTFGGTRLQQGKVIQIQSYNG